jgi:hypothetical protein
MTELAPTTSPLEKFRWLILAAILILTAGVYAQLGSAEFITLDDSKYVTANQRVGSGLSAGNVIWAWTKPYAGFYIPLTWVSLQIDATLFGEWREINPNVWAFTGWAGGFHLHNLALHLACVVFVYMILQRLTKSTLAAAAGAVLWALHPLRVESVAWVTERKDVLAGFWGFLAILIYLHFIEKNRAKAIWLTSIAMGISALAKPMFVTLPVLLLLLEYWPLKRDEKFLTRVIEKWPMFVIALVASVITSIAHVRNNTFMDFPLELRLSNAPISYCRYLWKHLDVGNLGLLYQLPASWPISTALGAIAILIAITAAAILLRKKFPFLLIGWLFFIIALLPNIGFVQAWIQALADRFTYLSGLGIALIAAFAIGKLETKTKPAAIALVALLAGTLAFFTYKQAALWHDPITLYRHSLKVERSATLHDLLATELWKKSQTSTPPSLELLAEAESEYRRAIELDPTGRWTQSQKNLEAIRRK